MKLNENIKLLPESGVSVKKRLGQYMAENPSSTLIRIDQSLMSMPLPPAVKSAMQSAVEETTSPHGLHLSSPWSGYASLKSAVAAHLLQKGISISEQDIFITSGLESAYACLSGLFAAENNVLLPSPCESHLVNLHRASGRNISYAAATPENDFNPLPDALGADLIYLASPSPVTGAALTKETLQKWVSFANENGAVILYDSSLSEYLPEGEYPHSIYEIEGSKECAIELFSFEKGYGVRELKIAYAIIPNSLSREEVRLRDLFCARQPSTATPPSFVMQRAAELLFSAEAREDTSALLSRIKEGAQILSEGLLAAGIAHTGSKTSPFLWAQCPKELGSWQCFDLLLEKAGLVVTPGSLFGYGGEGFFRITAFASLEEAKLAASKIAALFTSEEPAEKLPSEEESAALIFEESIAEESAEE